MTENRISELKQQVATLRAQLADAEAELKTERFRDIPRYERGTIVLARRNLFGKTRMWPARIEYVHLDYSSGTNAKGQPWENFAVSYAVSYQLADGTFSPETTGKWPSEVQAAPHLNDQLAEEARTNE